MRDQALSRRRFVQGSSAAAAGALLMPRDWVGAAPRSAPLAAGIKVRGATVNPRVYGTDRWVRAARTFNSYVGMPLATKAQKYYMLEGQYFTDPLPTHMTDLAGIGCEFIICFYPSRTTDERTKLAKSLHLLKNKGIVFQATLVNEWNAHTKFPAPQDYLDYWKRYAPVVKAAGVPACSMVVATSNKDNYAKIQPGFPTNPLPDRYWIDYYAEAYHYKVRLDAPGGLLHQAHHHGVPVGIAECGWSATGGKFVTMTDFTNYTTYLAGLAPQLQLGCVYWGSHGPNIVTGTNDPKIPGIRKMMHAFGAA
jgi:hypothetical protein